MGIKATFTEEQQEHIRSLVKRSVSAKKISADLDLPLTNVTYWVTKFRKEFGFYKPMAPRKAKEIEVEETEEESEFETTGFTVEEYNQKIVDAKDAHIKDLKEIILMLACKGQSIQSGEVKISLADV